MGAELIHSRPHDDVESLRVRAAQLEATLAERDNEVTRLKADLDAFRIRYRQEVGLLHERLDELEAAIDEAEMGVRAEKPTTPVDASPAADQPPVDSAPKFTSDAVRKLFRDVAKAIHPDLAGDDLTRNRRHMLMIEANRAYALGDEQRLRLILEAWQNSPEAVSGTSRQWSTRRQRAARTWSPTWCAASGATSWSPRIASTRSPGDRMRSSSQRGSAPISLYR
jgi:hypothetical protein